MNETDAPPLIVFHWWDIDGKHPVELKSEKEKLYFERADLDHFWNWLYLPERAWRQLPVYRDKSSGKAYYVPWWDRDAVVASKDSPIPSDFIPLPSDPEERLAIIQADHQHLDRVMHRLEHGPIIPGLNIRGYERCIKHHGYKISKDRFLGKGLYGSTFLACQAIDADKRDTCKVIIKVTWRGNYSPDESTIQKLAARFQLAPAIVEEWECDLSNLARQHFVAMERMQGTLAELGLRTTASDARAIVHMLVLLEQLGIQHNDCHINNVMYKKESDGNRVWRVIDFGNATDFDYGARKKQQQKKKNQQQQDSRSVIGNPYPRRQVGYDLLFLCAVVEGGFGLPADYKPEKQYSVEFLLELRRSMLAALPFVELRSTGYYSHRPGSDEGWILEFDRFDPVK